MKYRKYIYVLSGALLLVFAAVGLSNYLSPRAQSSSVPKVASLPVVIPAEEQYPYVIAPRSTLSSNLGDLGIEAYVIHQIVEAAKPVSNLGYLRAGTRFQLYYSDQVPRELTAIKFRFSPVEMLEVRKTEAAWVAEKLVETVELRTVTFTGIVKTSLWESAVEAKMDPSLISELAEVFAWQVDFAREVRLNDLWRISVEQKWVKGEAIGWGSILAAEYENAGTLHSAALFRLDGEPKGYFAPDGTSLKKMFLKSPIRYGRISSRFSRKRFHPILKHNRPHLGVDYAAPRGTPIRAVGNGVVTFAARRGGGGNTIKVRHNSMYTTAYKHLHGFAKGIRVGSIVEQGQTIGYVGTTGLSTGPHLHFEFYQAGRFVDPLGQKFPSADPVPPEALAQFQLEAQTLLETLPDWADLRQVSARSPASTKNL